MRCPYCLICHLNEPEPVGIGSGLATYCLNASNTLPNTVWNKWSSYVSWSWAILTIPLFRYSRNLEMLEPEVFTSVYGSQEPRLWRSINRCGLRTTAETLVVLKRGGFEAWWWHGAHRGEQVEHLSFKASPVVFRSTSANMPYLSEAQFSRSKLKHVAW